MRGRLVVARHLDGEAGRPTAEVPAGRETGRCARRPIDRRHCCRGSRAAGPGLELREVALGEGHARGRRLAARLASISSDESMPITLRLRKALTENPRDVARAAAEIVDRVTRPRPRWRHRDGPSGRVPAACGRRRISGRDWHPKRSELSAATITSPRKRRRLHAIGHGDLVAFLRGQNLTFMNSSCIPSVMPFLRAMAPCEAMQYSH